MPDVNLGQLAASVYEKKFGTKPTDNIFTARALFHTLNKEGFKESAGGGRVAEESIMYAENPNFHSYGEYEELDTTHVDTFDAARFDWKIVAGTIVYSELERLRAQAGERKFDVIAEKISNGRETHIADLNRQMWSDGTGNGGDDIAGLAHLISATPTTGTVGGINRATWSFWRNRQTSGAQTSTPFDNLRSTWTSIHNQCSLGGKEHKPTAVITDRTVFEGYEGTLVQNVRYGRKEQENRGDAAFMNDALQFKGMDVFYDEDATAGYAYFLNNKFLKMPFLKGGWMKMYPEVDPANQLANVHKLATFATMSIKASRHLGVVTAIT